MMRRLLPGNFSPYLKWRRVSGSVVAAYKHQIVRTSRQVLGSQIVDIRVAVKAEVSIRVGVSRIIDNEARSGRDHLQPNSCHLDRRRREIVGVCIAELQTNWNRAAGFLRVRSVIEQTYIVGHGVTNICATRVSNHISGVNGEGLRPNGPRADVGATGNRTGAGTNSGPSVTAVVIRGYALIQQVGCVGRRGNRDLRSPLVYFVATNRSGGRTVSRVVA